MIVYPENWQQIGTCVSPVMVEDAILSSLKEIDCSCLSFSGGLDSSLLLYYMITLGRKVRTFTVACSVRHPDIRYSQIVIKNLEERFGVKIEGHQEIIKRTTGDQLVRQFYFKLQQWTDSIIAGDGLDEFMCGYYEHQRPSTTFTNEEIYFGLLQQLQQRHLKPLDKNSGNVKVYLPYLSDVVTRLFWQIPLADKVDKIHRKRIMLLLAKGKLPEEVINRRKYGFGTKEV